MQCPPLDALPPSDNNSIISQLRAATTARVSFLA
jgi:hypothetical protein